MDNRYKALALVFIIVALNTAFLIFIAYLNVGF